MKDNLSLIVGGATGSGKSTLIYLLKNFLTEVGFEVEVLVPEGEEYFDSKAEEHFDEKINKVKAKMGIKIKEYTLNRPLKENDGL